ncbi:hypothetical protein [Sphingobacterium detergens]|uniref:Uncharacterized protein n=1 Tax=Sphingobacterium detergens TaxID=1145106 RepID=A0A420ALJ6_SPHD1|nr:hypothetical protein [Sphingobacterium detergens]RKE45332.1 hypothetical protein DFQ12_4404 [Sphingobacterium detergens]
MKVDRFILIVVMLLFELFNSRNAMAQQASLTIRLGTFISVSCVTNHVYLPSGDSGKISLDSLVFKVPGPFELQVISERVDIGKEVGSETTGHKSFIFGNRPPIAQDKGVKGINGQGQIRFPLQPQTNTCVSITAL